MKDAYVSYDGDQNGKEEECGGAGSGGNEEQEANTTAAEGDSTEGGSGPLGSIYILETSDKRLIKIGYSTRLTMRLEQHRIMTRTYLACDVRLIGFFPGTLQSESAMHRIFAPYRVHSDWYEHNAVLKHIAVFGFNAARDEPVYPNRGSYEDHGADNMAQAMVRKRWAKTTAEERSDYARKMNAARWGKKKKRKANA